ncbi:fatty acyl-AMP ligase [Williamsia sp. CHRR-6]|uniref:fatty acyl-AMP ligase n=1 Tax=Williamsia sp. CHRR-6 TaxID=2835871 RepID=UPI001BDA448E|nr:fatty acyl-AMP ligase [Williamsia sp. CHRR-6]MBT0566973.1 fatty acyl-AMP ligase [Williamsia sp. CHRR-6]
MTSSGTLRALAERLAHHRQVRGDEPAVIVAGATATDPTATMTYRELDRAVHEIADALGQRYPVGSRLLLSYPHSVEFPAVFLGACLAGMVTVPVPVPGRSRYASHRMAVIAQDAEAVAIITADMVRAEVTEWAVRENLQSLAVDGLSPLDHPVRDAPTRPHLSEVGGPRSDFLDEPSRTVLLQYTSGSTSAPKGVMVSIANLFANIDLQNTHLHPQAGTVRRGGWIPHHHDMGLIGLVLPGILNGAGYVALEATAFLKRPIRWLQIMSEFRVGLTAAPDFAYRLCADRVRDDQLDSIDLSCLLVAVNGSEPVQSSTMRAFAQRCQTTGFLESSFAPAYGLAESTLIVSGRSGSAPMSVDIDADAREAGRLEPVASGTRVAASGPLLRPQDLAIVDTQTHAVSPDGSIGEIWLRGPSVAAGYWGHPPSPADFAAYTPDGEGPFLRTGDLGAVLDGHLYVVGRRKETIVLRGRVLHPHDIEHEMRRHHPELAGGVGAVFPLLSDGAGTAEVVVATHEIRSDLSDNALDELTQAIRATVTREFGVHAAGVYLLAPGTVLRTTSGKIRRADMRTELLAGRLRPVAARFDSTVAQRISGDLRHAATAGGVR